MSKKAEQAVENAVIPIIEQLGYEYVGTEIKKNGPDTELIVYADKSEGIGLDDCEKISRAIDDVIEELDPVSEGYFLCVSSPGLDRPLKSERDFKRSIGKEVDVKPYKAQKKQKMFTGKLISFNENSFIIESDGKQAEFEYSETAIVRLHVDI